MYDLVVIGGGTGGLRAAVLASRLKKRVAIVDPSVLGGTCLNSGCIPTKAMLHASDEFLKAKHLSELGITATPKLNFLKLMNRVRGIIDDGQSHIMRGIRKNEYVEVVKGKARFVSRSKVIVGTRTLSAKKFLISTGAKNMVVPIAGLWEAGFLDNEKIINLKKLPDSVVLIGGGYISMEFATFFNNLGCKVTVLEYSPRILGMLDEDVSSVLKEHYVNSGVKIFTNARISSVKKAKGKKTVSFSIDGSPKKLSVSASELVMATGRIPNTAGLDLAKAGVKTGRRDAVLVNDYLSTSNSNVSAIGDVTGRAMFAHAVKREARIIVNNLFFSPRKKMDFSLIPWAVFTSPVVAGVGLSERQLVEKNFDYDTSVSKFSRVGKASILRETEGFLKVMFEKGSGKLLGAVIIGPDADNLIHEVVAVMNSSSPTINVLRKSIHVHPTLAEVFESI